MNGQASLNKKYQQQTNVHDNCHSVVDYCEINVSSYTGLVFGRLVEGGGRSRITIKSAVNQQGQGPHTATQAAPG